jgi:hypothetical protein
VNGKKEERTQRSRTPPDANATNYLCLDRFNDRLRDGGGFIRKQFLGLAGLPLDDTAHSLIKFTH